MPVKRTRLVRAQQATYLSRAKELQAAGLDCEIPDEWQENSSSLDIIVAPPEYNMLCELPTGFTAYAILMRLVALRSNLILENFGIASEWDSESITLCSNARGLYRVGAAFEFTEDEALNYLIEDGLHFRRRGDVAKGWLLASGLRPIPEEYRDRMIRTSYHVHRSVWPRSLCTSEGDLAENRALEGLRLPSAEVAE